MSTRQKQVWLLQIAGIVLVFFGAIFFLASRFWSAPGVFLGNDPTPEDMRVQDPLTGMLVENAREHQQVYGVMIDEHVDARPQSGIDQAFLVIEAPVEAGIPRLLAFFAEESSVEMIGPVRSARPYFVDFALEFDALYTHVGGSNEALEKIKAGATFDLNEFWNDRQFWRATDRYAPYNTYTSTELLRAYVQKKRDAGTRSLEPLYGVWKFKRFASEEQVPQQITVRYVDPGYVFSWDYDTEQKKYVRSFGNKPMKTKEGNEIRVSNVVVAFMDVEIVDAVGRRHIQTIGEGDAFVFMDGKKQEAIWKKPSASERLRFYHPDGTEMELNPGKTWIHVLQEPAQVQEKTSF